MTREYRPTVTEGNEVRGAEPGETPTQWSVYELGGDDLPQWIADFTNEGAAKMIAEGVVCPSCGYAGGDDYDYFDGFRVVEVVQSTYVFEITDKIVCDAASFDVDAEQSPMERYFSCGHCLNEWDIPEGVNVEFT